MLIELWLHRHEYISVEDGEVKADPPFLLPTADEFEALRRVTRHLVKAVTTPNPPLAIPKQLVRFYDQLVE